MRRVFLLLFFVSAHVAQAQQQEQPKTILSLSMGRFAPFGMRVAEEMPSGFGGFLSVRCNMAAFTPNKYTISNGRINDVEWTWHYLDKKKYARAEIFLGLQVPLIRPQELLGIEKKKIGITCWLSGGMLYARYLYQFEREIKNGVGGPTWVRDLDQGGVGFDMEAGVQVRAGAIRIHFGTSGFLHRTEAMFVAGVGWEFGAE